LPDIIGARRGVHSGDDLFGVDALQGRGARRPGHLLQPLT
jgi:hypothetical protein